MEYSKIYENYCAISEKTFQVLRIKKKLEERRQSYIDRIKISTNSNEIKSLLASLADIGKRELRILSYCKKGLKNSRDIIEASREDIIKAEGFLSKLMSGINFKRNIKFIEINIDETLYLVSLLKWMHDDLYLIINQAEKDLRPIILHIEMQIYYSEKLASSISDIFAESVQHNDLFVKLEKEHSKELELVQRTSSIVDSWSLKAGKAVDKIKNYCERINPIVQKYPKLARMQLAMSPLPINSNVAIALSPFYGIIFYPVYCAIGHTIRFSPTLIALAMHLKEKYAPY